MSSRGGHFLLMWSNECFDVVSDHDVFWGRREKSKLFKFFTIVNVIPRGVCIGSTFSKYSDLTSKPIAFPFVQTCLA